jgi:arylsulfatase A-like enzyme
MRRPLALLLTAVLALGGLAVAGTIVTAPAGLAAETKPNVVLILTDDMRADELRYMRYTRRLFRDNGTTFTQAISPHPLCCPARAELMTGQFAQNNGVHHNVGEWGGYKTLAQRDRLLFRWFDAAGYRTAYSGKFMNGYHGGDVRGLDYNDAAVARVYRASGVVTYNNGDPVTRRGHQTHYTTRSAIRSIERAGDRPFFSWVGYVAPHGMTNASKTRNMTVPPPGYESFRRRSDRRPLSVRKPSFNERRPYGSDRRVSRRVVKRIHRHRVRALYAVDDGVKEIVGALKDEGEWRDTILVFASDNGMGLGSHRLLGKNNLYHDTLRIPLMLTGPGVPQDRADDAVASLVDLPGTLARLAGVEPLLTQDGADLFDLPDDRAVLIQAGRDNKPWGWRGVYTRDLTFVRYADGGTEFYDRASDPHELDSRPRDPRTHDLDEMLTRLRTCAGPACAATYGRG